MSKLSISHAWDETRGVLARDGRLLASVALALILLPQVIMGVMAPPKELSGQEPPSWIAAVAIVVALIGVVAQVAMVRLAIRHGTSVGEAIGHGAKRFLSAFAAILIVVFALVLLAVLLMVAVAGPEQVTAMAQGAPQPGVAIVLLGIMLLALLIGVRIQLVVPVASEEGGGPIRVLSRSWQLTAGNYWRMLAFLLLVLVCAVISIVVAGMVGGMLSRLIFGDIEAWSVGALLLALFTAAVQAAFSVVISVMLARIYVQVAGGDRDQLVEPSVPNSAA